MIGFLYLIMAFVSDAGARIKELTHDINAHIDPRTNTYIGYDGRLKDAKTDQLRIWGHNENGDEVLYNKKWKVVRNLSKEERERCLKEAKAAPGEHTVCKVGNQTVNAEYTDCFGITSKKKKALYIDLETELELIKVCIPSKFTFGKGELEFYAYAHDPLHLVRLTDEEKERERNRMPESKNWVLHPEKEKQCIERFNNAPLGIEAWCKNGVIW